MKRTKRPTSTRQKSQSRKTRGSDLLDKALRFYLENKTIREAQEYAARGRRLKDLSVAALRERCAVTMTAYAKSPTPENRAEFGDCEGEYTLRGLPFPPEGDDIKAAMKLLIEKATEQGKRILADRKLSEEIGRELLEDTAAALEEADQSKKK